MNRKSLNLVGNTDGKNESKSDEDLKDTSTSESTSDQKESEQDEVNNSDSQETKEEQARKQVLAWQGKINRGEATLNEAPMWVVSRIQEVQKENESKEKERIKEIMEEEKRENQFNKTLENVRELGLTEEQAKKVEEIYEEAKKKGYNNLDALEFSLFKNNINFEKQSFKTSLGLTSGAKPLDLQNSEPKKRTKEELYKEVYGE